MQKKVGLAILLSFLLVVSCVSTGGSKDPVVITLKANEAVITTSGSMVLEEGESGYNIGWWETTDDEVTWDLEIPVQDDYAVLLNFSCDPQFPGSVVNVTINGETFEGTIFDTGGWTYYASLEVGTINLPPGKYEVLVKAASVANRFVCNLREIRLLNTAASQQ